MTQNRLQILARRLKFTDRHLVHLLARRIRIAKEVAMIKVEDESPLYRPEIETKRLNEVSDWAESEFINPEFARSILYQLIGESCKNQIAFTDALRLGEDVEKFNPTYEEMRQNLITLTRLWAPEYENYGKDNFVTSAVIERERNIIHNLVSELPDKKLCLEVGCATARESRLLSNRFRQVAGFDISSDMIFHANQSAESDGITNHKFFVHDMEEQWPFDDNSVSMVIMNNAVCSDIRDLPHVISEVSRVLMPRGRFIISFYNKKSWSQKVFFPWPLDALASLDQDRYCLEVRHGDKNLAIYAKPYSIDAIKFLIPRKLSLLSWCTHPTLMSVLPSDLLKEMNSDEVLTKMEESLIHVDHDVGSYITLTGEKI